MSISRPQRGEVVVYQGEYFFFQPNGNECYLYRFREDLGDKSKKVFRLPKRVVTVPTNREEAIEWAQNHIRDPTPKQYKIVLPYPSRFED